MSVKDAMRETYEALTALGLPGRYEAYPVSKAPKPPFFTYVVDDQNEKYADDTTYAVLPKMHVELFTQSCDPDLNETVREALETAFGPIEEVGSWSQSEMCHIEQYDFTYTKEV